MRIYQFIAGSGSWGTLSPETMNEKGLGGRETALLNLSQVWAREGHEVFNFVPTDVHQTLKVGNGILHFAPYQEIGTFTRLLGGDALVSWEEPRIFGEESLIKEIKVRILEMQVAHLTFWESNLDEQITAYAALSNWAGDFLAQQGIPRDKVVVFPNGVDLSRYPDSPLERGSKSTWDFFYSSSPDRGLADLLKMWPDIRKIAPGSLLHVFYGLDHWADTQKWSHNMQSEAALDVIEGIKQEGVITHGKVGQKELARIQSQSDILTYPCNTMQPTETGCITVVEAGASYSPAIITECDCLGSEFRDYAMVNKMPLDYSSYIESIGLTITDENVYKNLQKMGRELAESRRWEDIGKRWLTFIEERL